MCFLRGVLDIPPAICCDLSGRGRLRVTGKDRTRFLNGQVTNDVKSLPPGQGCYALFTHANGKIRADAVVLNMGDSLWVDLEAGHDRRIASDLEKFVIADDVEIENLTVSWSAFALVGHGSAELLRRSGLCAEPPGKPFKISKISGGDFAEGLLFRSHRSVHDSFDVWVKLPPPGPLEKILAKTIEQAHGKTADLSMLEILRVEAGIPRFGSEMDENTLPQEAGVEAIAVSYSKGCYIGQEVIARIKSRGRVNRTLVRLQLPPSAQPGDSLRYGDREVGRLGSAVTSSHFGRIGLAIVRREAATPDTLLSLPQREARVVENFISK